MSGIDFSNMQFQSPGGSWTQFPYWARYFYDVGKWIIRNNREGLRTVVGISAPARPFLASLIAFGVVSERAMRTIDTSKNEDFHSYLQSLIPDKPGVVLKDGSRELLGVLDGEEKSGWLKIQVEDGPNSALWRFVKPEDVKRLRLSQVTLSDLPERQTGKKIGSATDFARYILPELDFVNFSKVDELDCICVGRKSYFRRELVDTRIRSDLQEIEGCLQEVIRASPFPLKRVSKRTDILGQALRKGWTRVERTAPVVVFDGANAFARFHSGFLMSNWVILFDRNDSNFSDGVQTLNARFVQYRIDDVEFHEEFPRMPPGIDITIFREEE